MYQYFAYEFYFNGTSLPMDSYSAYNLYNLRRRFLERKDISAFFPNQDHISD